MSKPGQWNSSITRVRPVFQRLLNQNADGQPWLSQLLHLAPLNKDYAVKISQTAGLLLPCNCMTRPFQDRVLTRYGVPHIDLECCFEHPFDPPPRFLEYLIRHLAHAPKNYGGRRGDSLRFTRALLGKNGPERAADVRKQALEELSRLGAQGSQRKWWAFEGFTEVDCCLECPDLLLFIEGKRKERPSPATVWYPRRHQVVRNLEVAQAHAGTREYAVLVVAEQPPEPLTEDTVGDSLPHFSAEERDELLRHYLGAITWSDLCRAVGIDFSTLPEDTEIAVRQMRTGSP